MAPYSTEVYTGTSDSDIKNYNSAVMKLQAFYNQPSLSNMDPFDYLTQDEQMAVWHEFNAINSGRASSAPNSQERIINAVTKHKELNPEWKPETAQPTGYSASNGTGTDPFYRGDTTVSNLGDNAGRVLRPVDGSQFNDSGRNEQIASQTGSIPNKQKYQNYLYSLTPQVQSLQQYRDPARTRAFNNMLRSTGYGQLNVSDALVEHDVFNPGFTGQAPTREAFDSSIQTGAETAGHNVTQGEKDNAWNFYGGVQRNKRATSTLTQPRKQAYMNFIRGSVY